VSYGNGSQIHLIYGTDSNYVFPTAVSAASAAFYAAQKDRLVVHLFDFGVGDEQYDELLEIVKKGSPEVNVERHIIDSKEYMSFGAWRGSVATYSRMFVPDILPDVDWAIYVDGDTLWLGDIGELWSLRDETVSILASIDPPMPMGCSNQQFDWYRERGLVVDENKYFCAGLILMNLRKMREDRVSERCRVFLSEHPNPFIVDQTVLNYVLQGEAKLLPPQWGVFSAWHRDVDLTAPALVHYARDLPWVRLKPNALLSDIVMLWYDFCREILGRDELIRCVPWPDRMWRRLVFQILKKNQWVLLFHPYLKAKLRNTHGVSAASLEKIKTDWKRMAELRDLKKSNLFQK